MAHVQSAPQTSVSIEKLAAPFRAFARLMVRLAEANMSVQRLERLSNMSDAELSERGLTRETIVRHVFQGAL